MRTFLVYQVIPYLNDRVVEINMSLRKNIHSRLQSIDQWFVQQLTFKNNHFCFQAIKLEVMLIKHIHVFIPMLGKDQKLILILVNIKRSNLLLNTSFFQDAITYEKSEIAFYHLNILLDNLFIVSQLLNMNSEVVDQFLISLLFERCTLAEK